MLNGLQRIEWLLYMANERKDIPWYADDYIRLSATLIIVDLVAAMTDNRIW